MYPEQAKASPSEEHGAISEYQALPDVPKPSETRQEIIQRRIIAAIDETGSMIDTETALRIAQCESSFNEYAANANSSAKGLYQFTDTTWAYIKADGHQFDADENIKQFLIWYPLHPDWWVCR
jgi:Transglycosylase SLT domain